MYNNLNWKGHFYIHAKKKDSFVFTNFENKKLLNLARHWHFRTIELKSSDMHTKCCYFVSVVAFE